MRISTLIAALLLSVHSASYATEPVTAIVIHGGAGTILKQNITPAQRLAYHDALRQAVRLGHKVLKEGGSSEEAVIASITSMEDSPLFNAGHGAVLNHKGEAELDASIMRGDDRNAGAIAGVKTIKNPILAAREVLHHSPHVFLAGEGAETFAAQRQLELVDNEYFITERRQQQLKRIQAEERQTLDDRAGTVGAVALDKFGNITAATSTGGMSNKRYGRIGDVPVIGAGTYADNRSCGISATGHGEYFIRAAVAFNICSQSHLLNIPLQQAADNVVQQELVQMGGDGGIVGLSPNGDVVISFNSEGMYRAFIDADGREYSGIFKDD
jgi:L-asparaginase / beta-aspartyl-peptidase